MVVAITIEPRERARYDRIRELLERLDSHTDQRAAVLLALTDKETPNHFATLREHGLPIGASATVRQLFDYAAPKLGVRQIDREYRDYAILPLRELGILEPSTVVPRKELSKGGDLILRGEHRTPKSPNSAYLLTEEAEKLLATADKDWPEALDKWVEASDERRRRVIKRAATKRAAGGDHSDLIAATVETLQRTDLKDFELVFVDDADGDRIRVEWEAKLGPLGLMPDLASRYPDAILVNRERRRVWFVDAVTTDGEIDEVRRSELERWARRRRFSVAGYTTAYATWKRAAQRQAKMQNLAADSTLWIAEDGGKLFEVRSLAGVKPVRRSSRRRRPQR